MFCDMISLNFPSQLQKVFERRQSRSYIAEFKSKRLKKSLTKEGANLYGRAKIQTFFQRVINQWNSTLNNRARSAGTVEYTDYINAEE